MLSSYATVTDYCFILNEDEAVEQSRLDQPNALIADAPKIERQLFFASNEINVYLAKRYSLPIPVNSPYLKYAAVIIAWHNMEVFQEREHVRKRYEDIIKTLKLIADGRMNLSDENGNPIPDASATLSSSDGVSYGTGEVAFDSGTMAGYVGGYGIGSDYFSGY